MKGLTVVLLITAVAILAASCGISGETGPPDDPTKSDLEIRNVTVTSTDSSAVLRWNTTQQTVGTLSFGKTQTSLGSTRSSSLSGAHTAELLPLDSDTQYWFQISAATPMGLRTSTTPQSFRTLVSPDVNDSTPPVISNILVTGITMTSATVTWKTDDRTVGTVYYGYNSGSNDYSLAEPNQLQFARTHALTLNELSEDTTYYFRIEATNRRGLRTFSDVTSFETAQPPYMEIWPDTINIPGNGDFTFAIQVRNATNIAGIAFMLAYDPAMIEILSVQDGPFWRNNDGFLFLREMEDPSRGRVQYDASWKIIFLNGTAVGTLANGGGEVALIQARAKGDGTSSPLRLIDTDENGDGKPETRLFDHNRSLMNVHLRNGLVIKQVQ